MFFRPAGGDVINGGMAAQEPYVATSLMSTLTTLGLTTNLVLALDAGEGDSYTSGQSWLDLSGNGYDFFRGASAVETTDDPTFNGVADALSSAEYWSFDGGDFFRYDTSNETWMNGLHKDNALWSACGWVYPASSTSNSLFGTSGFVATNAGVIALINTTSGALTCNVHNTTGSAGKSFTANLSFAASAWQFWAMSINEAGNYFMMRNATASAAASGAITSPAAGDATYALELNAMGNASTKSPSGMRSAMNAFWSGEALTSWQLEQIYNKTRRRFGV